MSWRDKRASANGSLKKAMDQYQKVYPYIFHAVAVTNTPYLVIPQEALVLDKYDFVKSLFSFIGLDAPSKDLIPEIGREINKKYYESYFSS